MQRRDLRKVSDRFGIQSLSTAELLALIMRAGTRRSSVYELASRIAPFFEQSTIDRLSGEAATRELATLLPKTLSYVSSAVFELLRRQRANRQLPSHAITPKELFSRFSKLARKQHEYVYGIYLTPRLQVKREELLAKGSTDIVYVEPRDVLYYAVKYRTRAFVLLHNHPSGSAQPSEQDRNLTKRLHEAAQLLQLEFVDHLIVSSAAYYSFRESNDVL